MYVTFDSGTCVHLAKQCSNMLVPLHAINETKCNIALKTLDTKSSSPWVPGSSVYSLPPFMG